MPHVHEVLTQMAPRAEDAPRVGSYPVARCGAESSSLHASRVLLRGKNEDVLLLPNWDTSQRMRVFIKS